MAYLVVGICLLLWSAFSCGSKRGPLAALSLAALVLVIIVALRVYPPKTEALSLIAGTVAAALLLWLTGSGLPRWTGWLALFTGAAACAFALFGPAQGLFP